MPERPVWAILLTRDIASAMQLYCETLKWRFEAFPVPRFPCWVARSESDRPMAVFVDVANEDFPDAPELWLPHFTVDDLESCVHAAEEQGATVLREPFEIPGFGRVAALRQPGGGIVAWRSRPAT